MGKFETLVLIESPINALKANYISNTIKLVPTAVAAASMIS